MSGIHNKGWVALAMAVLGLIEQYFGASLGLGEEWVTSVIFILTPILVWLVPNRYSV